MLIPDANVLIYAFRKEFAQHLTAHAWLLRTLAGKETVGLTVPVELAFLRLMTKPLGELTEAPWGVAWAFIDALIQAPVVCRVHAGSDHSAIFAALCSRAGKVGDQVTDLYLAALAIERHATLISADKEFERVAGLKWINLLDTGSNCV